MSRAINNGGQPSEPILQSSGGLAVGELAPLSDWSGMSEMEHFVQFYETDTFLLDSLVGFIGTGLERGDAGIVVATQAHREALEERLKASGLDVAAARASGQFVSLDAGETLSKLMVDGAPDQNLFREIAGDIIARVSHGRPSVRIYGEMVALLWAEGKQAEAIRLEEFWNELHKTRSFSLLCGYPMNGFCGEALVEPLHNVCASHSRVIPAESYTALNDADDRLRAIIMLQQKARLLESEIAERKETEATLRSVKDELEVQVSDLKRLHEMSAGLASTLDIKSVLEEVLRAAMAVQHTDMGLLSLCDSERDGLNLHVHSGFDDGFLKQIEWVPSGGGACGSCYQQRRRVVVEDVEIDPVFDLYMDAARGAGVRACHSTPLITRSGNIIGVLSVHFRHPHRSSERETRLMDLYAQGTCACGWSAPTASHRSR